MVKVRIVDAGNDRAAFKIDRARAGSRERVDLVCRTDRDNFSPVIARASTKPSEVLPVKHLPFKSTMSGFAVKAVSRMNKSLLGRRQRFLDGLIFSHCCTDRHQLCGRIGAHRLAHDVKHSIVFLLLPEHYCRARRREACIDEAQNPRGSCPDGDDARSDSARGRNTAIAARRWSAHTAYTSLW